MSRKFFSGASLDQAVLAAARHHGLDPSQVAYTHRDKKHGFLNVRRKFVIEVDPASPERSADQEEAAKATPAPAHRQPASDAGEGSNKAASLSADSPVSDDKPARAPRQKRAETRGREIEGAQRDDRPTARGASVESGERKERPAPVTEDPLEAADMALGDVADFLYYDMHWDISLDDESVVHIELGGEDSHKIIEDDGRLLRSIEHLLPRLIRSKLGRGVSCTVDCEGFKEAHEEHLRALAVRIADEVASSGHSKLLEPMTPADRRLVHVSLVDHPDVDTESEGRGFKKRVRVVPMDGEDLGS